MLIIDIEIKKAIPDRRGLQQAGIEYCQGWTDYTGMGIACICTYDLDSNRSRVFLEKDLARFVEYAKEHSNECGGFNTRRFDLRLLKAHGVDIDNEAHYDALERIWLQCGLNPDRFAPATHGGWGLDAVMQATFGIGKSGSGAEAPIWWQSGQRGRVVDYCLHDVWLEAMLIRHMLAGRPIKAHGKPTITVPNPYAT